ncbi:MAG: SpoIIE family protein phosphatase [Bacillota bacterium]
MNYQQLSKNELINLIKEKDMTISQLKETNNIIDSNLENIIKSAPIGICLTDENGNFEYVNSTYCNIYGYENEELIDENFTLVVPDAKKEELQNLHDEFIKKGTEIRGEWKVKDKKGNFLTILADATRLKDENNNFKKLTYVIDITEKKELEEDIIKNRNHLDEIINQAQNIQKEFLPKNFPDLKEYNLDFYYQPSEKVGGDLYNTVLKNDKLIFYLSDVTGHSLGGALFNIFARETINNYLINKKINDFNPCEIIEELHQRYCQENFSDEYFIALIIGVLDSDTGQIRLCNAGIQVPPVILTKEGTLESSYIAGPPVSSAIDRQHYQRINEINFVLGKEDSLILSTDGLIEEKSDNEMFGLNRYFNILKNNYNSSSTDLINSIKREFKNFTGKKQGNDDISLLTIQRN